MMHKVKTADILSLQYKLASSALQESACNAQGTLSDYNNKLLMELPLF